MSSKNVLSVKDIGDDVYNSVWCTMRDSVWCVIEDDMWTSAFAVGVEVFDVVVDSQDVVVCREIEVCLVNKFSSYRF